MFNLTHFTMKSIKINKTILNTYISNEQRKQIINCFNTFNVNEFLYERSHGECGTLINRFIKHIAMENCRINCNDNNITVKNSIRYSNYYPVYEDRIYEKSIKSVPNDQFHRLVIFTYAYKTNADVNRFTKVINQLDTECCKRMDTLTTDEIFRILYAFIYLMPNKIAKLQFYANVMEMIATRDNFYAKTTKSDANDPIKLTKSAFIQTCFYLGLWKKNEKSREIMSNLLNKYLEEFLTELTLLDFSIIVNAAFKTSTPITCEAFHRRLEEEILKFNIESGDDYNDNNINTTNMDHNENDPGLFTNLIKSLRHNKIHFESVTNKINKLILSNQLDNLEFRGLAHLFAYLADNLLKNDDVITHIIAKCMLKLRKEHQIYMNNPDSNPNDMRAKDIGNFLWSCSHLNVKTLTPHQFLFLERVIIDKYNADEYKNNLDELIDTCLSLWILGFKSNQLIQFISMHRNDEQPARHGNSNRVKIDCRRKLLKSCIEIESPELLKHFKTVNKSNNGGAAAAASPSFNALRKAPEYLLNKPNLNIVYNILSDLKTINKYKHQSTSITIEDCILVSQIQDLNIAGICVTLSNKKILFIEVLDDNTTLSDGETPFGLMALKVRLLKATGHDVILLKSTDRTDVRVKEILDDYLNKSNDNNKILPESTTVPDDEIKISNGEKTIKSVLEDTDESVLPIKNREFLI